MIENGPVDWVSKRAACSVNKVFQEIKEGVRKDLATRNAQIESEPPFEITGNGECFFVVRERRQNQNVFKYSYRFEQTETAIRVTNAMNNAPITEATLTLNDAGECRLKVKDGERIKELEQWQFRQAALQDLLFGV